MSYVNKPSDNELPSSAKLVKSTLVAIIFAVIILVVAVLPAEYGIDPTGAGNLLGLTKMGDIKVSLAGEAAAEMTAAPAVKAEIKIDTEPAAEAKGVVVSPLSKTVKSDSITLSLQPNQGSEVKVKMLKGGKVSYKWTSSAGRANYDIHGDSANLNINYFNYSKGSAVSDAGVLEAEFDGKHGWFWRNRSGKPITITLEVEGEFTEMTKEV